MISSAISIVELDQPDVNRLAFIYQRAFQNNEIFSSLYKIYVPDAKIIELIALELRILLKSQRLRVVCAINNDMIIGFVSLWNPYAKLLDLNIRLKLKYARKRREITNSAQLSRFNQAAALPGNKAAIYHLAVLPGYQHQGVGHLLVNSIIDYDKPTNVAASEAARQIYLDAGFIVENIRIVQLGHDELPIYIMRFGKLA